MTEQMDQQCQEDLQRLKDFRLLDDDFLTKCFEGDTKYIQLVLRIVMEMPDFEVVGSDTGVCGKFDQPLCAAGCPGNRQRRAQDKRGNSAI